MEGTKLTVEQIDAEIERLQQKISDKDAIWDYTNPYNAYCEYVSPEEHQIESLDRTRRMIMTYELDDLPDYGDVMPLKNFIESCKSGSFIDYDGHGFYVKDGKKSNIKIIPSDVFHNAIRPDFDTIIWYNR